MNCPNCGAGVADESTKCEFCRTRLKTMACPDCLGLMFIGTRHCGHCGKSMVEAVPGEQTPDHGCPRCGTDIESIAIGDVRLSECHKCCGFWMSVNAFEELCSNREKQSAVLGYKRRREVTDGGLEKVRYVPCPVCSRLMNRSNFAKASGVIIDTCKTHGIWFDAEELPRTVQFICDGGLAIARQRELMDIGDQRKKLRNEKRADRSRASRLGLGSSYLDDEMGVKEFLQRLFD